MRLLAKLNLILLSVFIAGFLPTAWLTRELLRIADAYAPGADGKGRIVSVLEGGYDLDALADATAAHVRELMRR